MKITKHISFYFIEDRKKYINQIIENANEYKFTTDIFIHTNKELSSKDFSSYVNGTLNFIFHDLTGTNPFYLTWKCRDLLYNQREKYDIFMYIEDDMLVPNKAIEYWLKYSLNEYNLGFLRIERNNSGDEYVTDVCSKLKKKVMIENKEFVVNHSPYCAFWIYTKSEFNKFTESKYFNISNIKGYAIREASAIGFIGKETVLPVIENKLDPDCRIYHLPNNYVKNNPKYGFASIKFTELI